MARVLIIDDEAEFRESLAETIADLGHESIGAGSVEEGLQVLDQGPFDAIFVDFRMPGINGLEAIRMLRAKRSLPIVMITAFIDSANTIAAMKLGAFDHLTKPVGRTDIGRVLTAIAGEPSAVLLRKTSHGSAGLIGQSSAMRDVLKMIGRLANGDSNVLISGETGSGKEIVARTIHASGERSAAPFVPVNCAAIPDTLLESELFGHVKGAFTGAVADRKGSFELAGHGTLLLDEIGDMNLNLQAKLLRALQEREVIPVGGSKPIKIHARFLAATHQDLAEMVKKKTFREDLYYRLNVIELHLPPLRDRRADLLPLIESCLYDRGNYSVSPEALRKLETYSWPGNIRELKNVMERALIVCRGNVIGESDIRFLSREPDLTTHEHLDLPQAVAALERKMITEALDASSNNRSEAARKLGIQRQLLYAKMKEHRIDLS